MLAIADSSESGEKVILETDIAYFHIFMMYVNSSLPPSLQIYDLDNMNKIIKCVYRATPLIVLGHIDDLFLRLGIGQEPRSGSLTRSRFRRLICCRVCLADNYLCCLWFESRVFVFKS